jgi:long-chain fatty acid transport protein
MLERFQKAGVSCLLALLAFPATSHASAFALFEEGAKALGLGGAFAAQANDPSAIFYNVAGIAFLKGTQIYGGGALIAPFSDFTGADPFPGTGVSETGNAGLIVPPHLYFTQQLSETIVLGVGLDVPFGLRTEWQNANTTYTGRFISKKGELNGFALNPAVAFKLADRLSVGAGVDIRFSSVQLERNIAGINPFTFQAQDVAALQLQSNTNTGVGFNVGLLAKPSESLSIGVSYRSSITVNYTGTATFNQISTGNPSVDARVARVIPFGTTPVNTSIKFPGMVLAGVAYTWNGDWTVEGDVDWYNWSTYQSLPITFPNYSALNETIPQNYSNSWQFRLGVEHRFNETWTIRGGVYRDQSPVPDAAVGPLLPDADRTGASIGGTWRRGRLHIDAANLFTFFSERSTNGMNYDNYNGTYKNFAEVFSLSVGYGF